MPSSTALNPMAMPTGIRIRGVKIVRMVAEAKTRARSCVMDSKFKLAPMRSRERGVQRAARRLMPLSRPV